MIGAEGIDRDQDDGWSLGGVRRDGEEEASAGEADGSNQKALQPDLDARGRYFVGLILHIAINEVCTFQIVDFRFIL